MTAPWASCSSLAGYWPWWFFAISLPKTLFLLCSVCHMVLFCMLTQYSNYIDSLEHSANITAIVPYQFLVVLWSLGSGVCRSCRGCAASSRFIIRGSAILCLFFFQCKHVSCIVEFSVLFRLTCRCPKTTGRKGVLGGSVWTAGFDFGVGVNPWCHLLKRPFFQRY